MHLKFRNVNSAFRGLVEGFHTGSIPTKRTSSRVGDVLMIEEPMTITYEKPLERVLFNQARDCNPFFHLYESLWMLAGRNDVEPLKYYSSKIGDIASDDGKVFNGAYGYRWRQSDIETGESYEGYSERGRTDQLKILIDHLKRVPGSRRAVLQMWNVESDLLKLETTKDVCCNLSVLFSIRSEKPAKKDLVEESSGRVMGSMVTGPNTNYLDMTVTNRSNDMIWGMLGANVVHFSFLQEYMAACIGVEVGVYNQFTNNLHVYVENNGGFHPEKWLESDDNYDRHAGDPYERDNWKPFPLVRDPVMFDREVCEFVEENSGKPTHETVCQEWAEPFLQNVAQPMCAAWNFYKAKRFEEALAWCEQIAADDWRVACTNWMLKRKANHERKQEVSE